jgi:hypothetical protein
MNKNNQEDAMASISEVKSTVNMLEKSPSKSAGGSTTHSSPSVGGANSASGSVGEFKSGCFGGGNKK